MTSPTLIYCIFRNIFFLNISQLAVFLIKLMLLYKNMAFAYKKISDNKYKNYMFNMDTRKCYTRSKLILVASNDTKEFLNDKKSLVYLQYITKAILLQILKKKKQKYLIPFCQISARYWTMLSIFLWNYQQDQTSYFQTGALKVEKKKIKILFFFFLY